jgi:hypothetical protein
MKGMYVFGNETAQLGNLVAQLGISMAWLVCCLVRKRIVQLGNGMAQSAKVRLVSNRMGWLC